MKSGAWELLEPEVGKCQTAQKARPPESGQKSPNEKTRQVPDSLLLSNKSPNDNPLNRAKSR